MNNNKPQSQPPQNNETGTTATATSNANKSQQGGFLSNLVFNIVIPTLILSKFSTESTLGPTWGIVVALAFPISYGLYDLQKSGKVNFFSVLGIVSVVLTGGISLLQLDPQYIAIKEAAIPGFIGLAILISQKTSFPLVKLFILNDQVVDLSKLHNALEKTGNQAAFNHKVNLSSYIVAGSFFLSSTLNYLLAKWILVSPPGTTAYNEELGKMTALSYPVIALPSMLVMFAAIWYLFVQITKLTGLKLEDLLNDPGR